MKEDLGYCVYTHNDKEGNIRYVGSGRLRRANLTCAKSGRSKKYEEYVSQFGNLEVVIFKDGLSKDESIKLEQRLYDSLDKIKLLNCRRPHGVKQINIDFSEYFYYDESSPSFLRWKIKTSNRNKVGSVAGCLSSHGYYFVRLKGKLYMVHRIIYSVLNHTEIATNMCIDHQDGNRRNNNINNLKLVTHAENSRNLKNTSRSIGVYMRDGTEFVSYVNHPLLRNTNGVPKHIVKMFSINKYGYDEAFRLAVEARKKMIEDLENEFGVTYSDRHLGNDQLSS